MRPGRRLRPGNPLSFPVALTMLVAFFFIPFLIMLGWVLVVSVTLMVRREAAAPAA
jgi:hypothetical protein